jgi:hypothetical protein
MCDRPREPQLDQRLLVEDRQARNPRQFKHVCLAFLQGRQKIQRKRYVPSEIKPYANI